MQPPRHLVTQMWRLPPTWQKDSAALTALGAIPGMVETTIIAEESMAYLKMEYRTLQHPHFIRLKEQLQSE